MFDVVARNLKDFGDVELLQSGEKIICDCKWLNRHWLFCHFTPAVLRAGLQCRPMNDAWSH
jgi:hypothetical protein